MAGHALLALNRPGFELSGPPWGGSRRFRMFRDGATLEHTSLAAGSCGLAQSRRALVACLATWSMVMTFEVTLGPYGGSGPGLTMESTNSKGNDQ